MDQGWNGTFIEENERKAFIKKLHCDYGTSGGLWVYHCGRWDRLAYFLPHPRRTAAAIRRHHEDGARGCMFYQGPVINPGVELNIAVGGRMLVDPHRTVEDALEESIELYYQPRNAGARKDLVELFLQAEEAYFGQWDPQRFSAQGRSMPGELHLTDLFGTSPGPAHFLMEPYLNSDGRRNYKKRLLGILQNLASLEGQCADGGRLGRISEIDHSHADDSRVDPGGQEGELERFSIAWMPNLAQRRGTRRTPLCPPFARGEKKTRCRRLSPLAKGG